MTMTTKKAVFQEHLEADLKASKQEKGGILNHVYYVTKMERKSTIRKFKQLKLAGTTLTKGRGRQTIYGPLVTAAP